MLIFRVRACLTKQDMDVLAQDIREQAKTGVIVVGPCIEMYATDEPDGARVEKVSLTDRSNG